jgi:tyrosine-protein phosphatase SIW14
MLSMATSVRVLLAGAVIALLVGGPWWYRNQQELHYRNFRVVTPGVLYRSGQLDVEGLRQIVRRYGIRTIVSLRADDTETARTEEAWARRAELNYVRIPPRPWRYAEGSVPAEIGLAAFRAVMDKTSNYPVLVHCFRGVHRTGAYCAVYRMDYEGWSSSEALAEMRLMGYDTLEDDQDIFAYLLTYRPTGRVRLGGDIGP